MKVYRYHGYTGELVGETTAQLCPITGQDWIKPKYSTEVPPPNVSAKQVAVFDNGAWRIEADYRGQSIWRCEDAMPSVVTEIGLIPEGYTAFPPTGLEFPKWNGGAWAEDMDLVLAKKLAEIVEFKRAKQAENFTYQGVEFYADDDVFSKTKQRCESLEPTDPVPTPAPVTGNWKSAEFEEDGSPKLIPMTVADFYAFCDARYDQSAVFWGAAQVHTSTVEAMKAAGATAEEIRNYDHTTGWE